MAKRGRKKNRLETWMKTAATPVFLLTARREVVFFNSGCEELTGWKSEDVVGRTCEYASHSDASAVETLTCSLCPPPEVLKGETTSVPTYLPVRDGSPAARLIHFFPLEIEAGRVKSVLGVVGKIEHRARPVAESPAVRLHAELAALRIALRRRFGTRSFVCRSPSMQRVLEQVQLAQHSDAPVFLSGEPGTGKEHAARLIHYQSEFRSRSFVPLDCRRLPAEQLKQTLQRIFQPASEEAAPASPAARALWPGTVLLDSVDHLPRDLQEMLVDVYGESSAEGRPRLMSAGTADLKAAVDDDRMRCDFFYRFTPLRIELPPLRRRPDDLELLAQHFLELHNHNAEQQIAGFAEGVWEQLREYNWPGNLDELAAVVEEARSNCSTGTIQVDDLPFRFRTGLDAQSVGPSKAPRPAPLEPLLARVEKEHIEWALQQSRDNKSQAAELLGIPRARLYRRMEALGIGDPGESQTPE